MVDVHERTQEEPVQRAFDTIVVGVDGSQRNHAAVVWAAHEADEKHKKLLLVAANDEYAIPMMLDRYPAAQFEGQVREMLDNVKSKLKDSKAECEITAAVGAGRPADVILRATEKADMVVVGKRGIGAVKRIMVGSTSIAVAGRSRVPVLVVPDDWTQPLHATDPVVVGVDGTARDAPVLDFAFERAGQLHAPLIAVHAWQLPALFTWSPQDIETWAARTVSTLNATLKPWVDRYPEVELVRQSPQANAAMALLDAGEIAQLIVLGRHTGPAHLGGFSFGSTARATLHYSACPVAVIPAPSVPDQEVQTDNDQS